MDLNAIKNKLSSLQQQKTKGGGADKNIFWKPSVGKQVVRIVPSKFNKANPFTEVYFPKMRVFAPVIVRGEEHEGVKL